MARILQGIRVLDLTRFFSGPQATLFLAGLGAEVIKVDDPRGGDPTAFAPPFDGPDGLAFERRDMGLAYLKRARGKRSITLDLKSDEGRRLLLALAAKSDVVVENFSADVADRLGVGYAAMRAANPRIVYCAISGYGATGPDRHAKAYDTMIQAAVGFMSMTGEPDGAPTKAASPLSDAVAGTFAAQGILAALLHRERTGEGQAIDVSMADCLFSLIFDEPIDAYERLGLQPRQGNRIMRFSPFDAFPAADGWVVVGAATDAEWRALLDAIGRPELKDDPDLSRVSWRITNNDRVDALLSAWTRPRTKAEIDRVLRAAGVPTSPVRSTDEVMRWAQLRERGMVVPLVNPLTGAPAAASGPGFPVKFSATPAGYDAPAPVPGADTAEVLGALLGLGDDDVLRLRAGGII
jgi:crotonobetainyl-CoA:carnitine CoA-transferase CaiB-like acyl-CoA transferase